MVKLIGWAAILGIGFYTGILQAMLIFIGAAIVWLGALIGSLGGAI